MSILERVKALLGVTTDTQDAFFNALIDEMSQRAKNYCNIRAIPVELEPAIARMVVNVYSEQSKVSEIKEADRSFKFAEITNNVFNSALSDLHAFRVMF